MLSISKKIIVVVLLLFVNFLQAQNDLNYHLKKAAESTNIQTKIFQYEQAEIVAQYESNVEKLAFIYFNLGKLYNQENNTEKSIFFYKQSISISEKEGFNKILFDAYRDLAKIYKENKAKAKPIEQYIYTLKADSLKTDSLTKRIGLLEVKYNDEKNQRKLKELAITIQKRNYFLIVLLIILLSGIVFYFMQLHKKKIKHKNEVQHTIIQQQELASRAIIEAEENERKRIAQDLHDGIGQMMSAVKMNVSSITSKFEMNKKEDNDLVDKTLALIDESCKEIRQVSHNMMPNALLKKGLSSAIKDFIDKIDHPQLLVKLHTEGLNKRIDQNIETVLYRVIQEVVTNVIKHSNANRLDISLFKETDGITCSIEDNGNGFDVNKALLKDGIGLKNIKSRIEYLKGNVEFDSSIGNGTVVTIHVPFNKA